MREFSLADGAVELLIVRHAEATPDPESTLEHASYRDLPLNPRGAWWLFVGERERTPWRKVSIHAARR